MRKLAMVGLGSIGLALASCGQSSANEETLAALTELQDRVAIEDLLVKYYGYLGTGEFNSTEKKIFNEFFTEDAMLDINGIILNGLEEINGIYNRGGGDQGDLTEKVETFHVDYMHLDNLQIEIDGDTAVAKMFWTGVFSNDLNAPPQFEEMGREYDLLVKKDGKWLIQKRVVVADGGMPVSMNEAYKKHRQFDIRAN